MGVVYFRGVSSRRINFFGRLRMAEAQREHVSSQNPKSEDHICPVKLPLLIMFGYAVTNPFII